MKKVLLIGEPMAMFVANEEGNLEDVEQYSRMLAGAEVNVCIGLQRLGFATTYVTRLGNEPLGKGIFKRLEKENIDTSQITFDDVNKTAMQLKSKVSSGDPVVAYYRKHSAASHMSVKEVEKIDFSKYDYVHITGIPLALSLTCREAVFLLVKKAKEQGVMTSFDPNLRPTLWEDEKTMISVINEISEYCDIILPGLDEGRLLTGKDTPEEVAKFYLDKGIKAAIMTDGSKGAYVATENGCKLMPTFKVDKVVDTVGAGDGFAVGVISGRLDGLSLEEAAVRGNAIGAIQVTFMGDNEGLPTREELKAFMNR